MPVGSHRLNSPNARQVLPNPSLEPGTSTGLALGPRGAAGLCSASRAKHHSGSGPSAQTLGVTGNPRAQEPCRSPECAACPRLSSSAESNPMRKLGLSMLFLGFLWLCAQQVMVSFRAGIRPVLAEQYKQLDAAPTHQYSASATAGATYDAASRWFVLPGLLMLVGGTLASLSKRAPSPAPEGDA
jgi:hypothetical protein